MRTRFLLLATLALSGCTCGPTVPATDSGPGGTDAANPITIPDPGIGAADWGFGVSGHGAPGTAYPVGIVTASPGYLDGTLDPATGDGFYVFQTGPAFTIFTVGVFPSTPGNIDYVHVHDGAGLVFGAEIAPDMSTTKTGTWTLLPDHVYILEIHGVAGQFY